ncbi:hypothetical protein QYE76_013488 [Lolium multiflorum]|uniref:Uncharacterized protein n=1 Tax=Lolium multiflorum TaxID=4521 RepID=A0AAD8U0S2_LOLMU|nr:hypothetical protein QYE76_013488 [Lolium multiflorum]
MSRAAALLLCLVLVGSVNLTASFFDPGPPRRGKNSDVIGIDPVAFTDGGNRFVGEAANTIYGAAKRLLGRRYSDADVQREIELLPYAVVDEDGRPHVRVEAGDGGSDALVLSPEEIAADVLAKLKGTAEAFLGMNITKALITVPAYYKDAQRQATKDAGVIAGLEVLRILNDPYAAAISYGLLDRRYDMKILVFDLGGGTLDVTVMIVEDGVLEVLSISGDSRLGGQDFDQRVADHFVEVIKQKHGRDITGNSLWRRRPGKLLDAIRP